MRTYRDLFRTPEFTPLFVFSSAQVAASTMSGLALGTLVYGTTRSPLLSALSMFGASFSQVLGAVALMSAADRLPPRAAMTGLALVFCGGTVVLAVPGLPLWALFAVVLGMGLAASLGSGVRFGLLNEILPRDGYLLGRSVLSMSAGVQQIVGFAAGGVLVTALSPRGTLLVGAGLDLVAALVARWGLAARPPRAQGRPSPAETWRTNRRLWSSPARRRLYLALWVPNGLIVGCESLYVAYDPRHAGTLFASAAAGMLAGDTLLGRFVPKWWRERLSAPLRLLLAVPYLVFLLRPALPLAVAAVVLASAGYSAGLLLQERLMAVTPEEMSGQALGLQSSGTMTMQGVGAAIAGSVAQLTSASAAMAAMAAVSVAVTLALAPGLRPERYGKVSCA
ncbi:MFS transporter [Microbispora triticiradicis]|uniref:MFS transporter n=3 Tax=Microbispora TaxID=2005 RepID=A0ABY3M424_9ACTN|nr:MULTISPECIES: MFS transporter [Microbispora]RGA05920.1 MFS transporter [Microbispora triticiradicis]TLP62207.1 MFS transporter [Microbispora fusca]TYB66315.1 MFS transporter [Microbispora tritici]